MFIVVLLTSFKSQSEAFNSWYNGNYVINEVVKVDKVVAQKINEALLQYDKKMQEGYTEINEQFNVVKDIQKDILNTLEKMVKK